MAKLSAITTTKLMFDEGAAAATPAANDVVIYAKSDGLVYSKDDAGTETLLSSGLSSGVASGTSNPGSPVTGQQFFRTDRGLYVYYDGTRWVTSNLYHIVIPPNTTGGDVMSATNGVYYRAPVWNAVFDIWLVDFYSMTHVATTNSGSAFWTVALSKETKAAAYASSSLASFSTGTTPDTASQFIVHTVAIGALMGTSHGTLIVGATKTSTPGNLTSSHAVTYRLVIP